MKECRLSVVLSRRVKLVQQVTEPSVDSQNFPADREVDDHIVGRVKRTRCDTEELTELQMMQVEVLEVGWSDEKACSTQSGVGSGETGPCLQMAAV